MTPDEHVEEADRACTKQLKYYAALGSTLYQVYGWSFIILAFVMLFQGDTVLFCGFLIVGCFRLAQRVGARPKIRFAELTLEFAQKVAKLEEFWPTISEHDYKASYRELNSLRRRLWNTQTEQVPEKLLEYRERLYERWLNVIRQCPHPLK